jgi:proteasome lid subunit RPN8/RPN11
MTLAQQLHMEALEHFTAVMEQAAIRLEMAETEAEVLEIHRQVKVAHAWCLGGFEADEDATLN